MTKTRRFPTKILTLFFILAALGAAAATLPPFTLTLAPPKGPVRAGSDLHLSVAVTNKMDHQATFPKSWGPSDPIVIYQLHVLNQMGLPAPRKVLPCQRPPSVCGGSVGGTELKPGESFTDVVNVTMFYDLSQPGKYTIWVTEPTYQGANRPNGLVKSNVVTVTVVQ